MLTPLTASTCSGRQDDAGAAQQGKCWQPRLHKPALQPSGIIISISWSPLAVAFLCALHATQQPGTGFMGQQADSRPGECQWRGKWARR